MVRQIYLPLLVLMALLQKVFHLNIMVQLIGLIDWHPFEGAYSLLKNENPNYTTAVYYQADNGYKTIGASHELGGLSGDDFSIYIDEIVNFFPI